MAAEEKQTIEQWLEELASGDTNVELDDVKMQNLLRRISFPRAICTCGIVYFEGRGTSDSPPVSIQLAAKALLNAYKKGDKAK